MVITYKCYNQPPRKMHLFMNTKHYRDLIYNVPDMTPYSTEFVHRRLLGSLCSLFLYPCCLYLSESVVYLPNWWYNLLSNCRLPFRFSSTYGCAISCYVVVYLDSWASTSQWLSDTAYFSLKIQFQWTERKFMFPFNLCQQTAAQKVTIEIISRPLFHHVEWNLRAKSLDAHILLSREKLVDQSSTRRNVQEFWWPVSGSQWF